MGAVLQRRSGGEGAPGTWRSGMGLLLAGWETAGRQSSFTWPRKGGEASRNFSLSSMPIRASVDLRRSLPLRRA